MCVLSFALIVVPSACAAQGDTGQPHARNVVLTTGAWVFLNAKNYTAAIEKAQECIDEFDTAASHEQAELEKAKAPLPPKGRVPERERQRIFERGLLNDVATCYYIAGRAHESLRHNQLARDAYQRAASYTYARTWDPATSSFWSPAEVAARRLKGLK
jgi:hypothetical protein